MIVGVIVNYRRPDDTLASLRSLLASDDVELEVILVEQAPLACEHQAALMDFVRTQPRIHLLATEQNLGFAAACNLAIDTALARPGTQSVFLLNNDAFVARDCLRRMEQALDPAKGVQMVAAAMYRYDDPTQVDSLGIVFYGCGLAANRMHPQLPLLGPCGGAALYAARLLLDVRRIFGEVFDPAFFCYAEDTDLALRARALGYLPTYVDAARVLHKGSMTSGGSASDTVMYYGLRNSFIALIQAMPAGYFLRHMHKILLLLPCVLIKYAIQGRLRLLLRVVRDVMRAAPQAWRKRRQRSGLLRWSRVRDGVDSRFYEPAYLRAQLTALRPWRRGERHA